MKNGSLGELLEDENIPFDNDMLQKLEKFAQMLHEWNQTHNLTGARNIEAIYDNIVDSLYPLTFIDIPERLLDVGTGAGFPGLVLAITLPKADVVLCEPLNKRAAFLKYVVMELELSYITVAKMRVEELESEPFGLITSRAVTDTAMLLDLTEHLSNDSTQFLFYKGSRAKDEVEALNSQLNYDIVQWKKRKFLWLK